MSANSKLDRIGYLRLYTWWTLAGTGIAVLLVPLLVLVLNERGVNVAVLLGALLLAALARVRYTSDLVNRAATARRRREHLAAMALALGAFGYAAATTTVPLVWSFLPGVLASAVVTDLSGRRRRLNAGAGLAVLAAAIGAGAAALGDQAALNLLTAFYALAVVGFFTAVDVLQVWFWDVAYETEQARKTAGELAVAQERLRFAAELHDVQGQYLQAIVLKSELTGRLIGTDDKKAFEQVGEITELGRSALRDTREVVHGYRSTRLRSEIDNAVDLLSAAGIDTSVDGDASSIPASLEELFGAVVREGTTNLLRHSTARRCELTLTATAGACTLRLANDGATGAEADPGGSGITGLADRFAAVGGKVHGEYRKDGRFTIVASAPEPGRIAS